jgi:hypothetical protein
MKKLSKEHGSAGTVSTRAGLKMGVGASVLTGLDELLALHHVQVINFWDYRMGKKMVTPFGHAQTCVGVFILQLLTQQRPMLAWCYLLRALQAA